MSLKYTKQPHTTTLEIEGTVLTFSVPNEKELLAYGSWILSHFRSAIGDGGKLDPDLLTQQQLNDLLQADLEWMAPRFLEVIGLEGEAGEQVDSTTWGTEDKVRFLAWLDSESAVFRDWKTKFIVQKKRTYGTGSPAESSGGGNPAPAATPKRKRTN